MSFNNINLLSLDRGFNMASVFRDTDREPNLKLYYFDCLLFNGAILHCGDI